MPARGVKQVRQKITRILGEISGPMAERAVTEALIIGGGMAATMTPVDTSLLINSQFRIVRKVGTEIQGQMGYTAAYAAAVHDAKGTLKGQPRDPNDGSRGNFWDPAGEPEFLTKGFEMTKSDIDAAVKRNMAV
jgi:hypothetical protein